MLRIERLSPDAQELLRVLAAGRRLDHQILADASGIDPRVPIREAVAAQLVVADEEGFYAFRHALLREVVVDDLLPGERAQLHLALARALERRAEGLPGHGGAHLAAGIAHHYLESGDQPKALVASVRAARGRRGGARQRRGRALYSRALQLWDRVADAEAAGRPRPRRRCCAPPRGRPAASTSPRAPSPTCAPRWPSSATATRCAPPSCSELVAREQFTPGPLRRRRGDAPRGARRCCRRARARPARRCSPALAKELMLESRHDEAVEAAEEALEVARAVGDKVSELRALDAKGVALFGLGALRGGRAGAARGAARVRSDEGSSIC